MKRKTWSILPILVLGGLSGVSSAQERKITKAEIQPFAQGFTCSDPLLQWQFDNLISLHDENEKMRRQASRSRLPFIEKAADVGGDGDWLYRGVTDRQFNEQQILRLIFNDPTSVSESRWFTEKMFNSRPEQGDLVRMRSDFQNLPLTRQCELFRDAYNDVSAKITALIGQVRGATNAFADHVQIGAPLDATPLAIQFLTPHKDYAESYGEFVLHVKEVVKRGLDVERYNYHNPAWNYQIGSIYAADRDEYMVPSHIPSWDVQVVKVRGGSGWHRGNYGAPLYYYTKLFEPKNPCNVLGVEIDQAGPTGDDAERVPVGVLLRCPTGKKCESAWDHALPAASEQRLQAVVSSAKVAGNSLYYLPYAIYRGGRPEVIRQSSISTVLSYYDAVSDELKKNAELWQEVALNGYRSDLHAAVQLARKNPALAAPVFKAKWRESFSQYLGARDFSLRGSQVPGLIELAAFLNATESPQLSEAVLKSLDSAAERLGTLQALETEAAKTPALQPLLAKARTRFASFKNLSPSEEVALVQMGQPGKRSSALTQAVAKALKTDPAFAAAYWNIVKGDQKLKTAVLEDALLEMTQHPVEYKTPDGIALWRTFAPVLDRQEGRDSVMGLCINLSVAQAAKPAFKLAEEVATIGLPKDREITTLRALWDMAKSETPVPGSPETNKFEFFSRSMLKLYSWLLRQAEAQDAADHGTRQQALKAEFVQLLGEPLDPPEKLIGFSALNQIRQILKKDDLFLLPEGEKIPLGIEGETTELKGPYVRAVLKESMSTYYLRTVKTNLDREKDPRKQALMKKTLREVLTAYGEYAATQLAADLADPTASRLLAERFAWNPQENMAGLLVALADLTPNRGKRQQYLSLADAVKAQFPKMEEKIPAVFSADGKSDQLDPFWKELMK